MSRILETDLTKIEGDPTARAVPHLLHEWCKLKVTMPTRRGIATVQLDTRTFVESPLATAVTTVLLIAAGCLAMGVADLVSAPMWAAVVGLLLPSGVFIVLRLMPRKNKVVEELSEVSGRALAVGPETLSK